MTKPDLDMLGGDTRGAGHQLVRKFPAWVGLDSRQGRYLFGTEAGPEDGLVRPKQLTNITANRIYTHFKCERLFVHSRSAPDFVLLGIFVGNQNSGAPLNLGAPLLLEPFAVDYAKLPEIDQEVVKDRVIEIRVNRKITELLGAPLDLPTVSPGVDVTFQVEHIGTEPRRFLGALQGYALR